ncbi:TPA: hypothetical protein N0F65_006793 [Lagenidium giganteum]|uniref:Palmitoyltransferase n=1 Tax=Lagenidium giganteum TaxID=4803 RepID=A0AAV2ZEC9_9STRA|nr:TPA: hypothetical protein N0F65_006793 [Lagenidium giganteum]
MAPDKRRNPGRCGTGFNVKVWCNTEPCGVICAVLSWTFILYAESVVVGVIIYPWMGLSMLGMAHMFCFTAVAFLALISHGKAMLTDPGAVPESAMPLALAHVPKDEQSRSLEEQKYRTCRRCRQFKPGRAHHCSICERCVIKMDHHCPWVNNCVGLGNHKFFLLFIFYVFLMSLYALILVFFRYAKCMSVSCPSNGGKYYIVWAEDDGATHPVLFGLFTLCMMCDQYSVITTGTTQIDRLKGEVADTLGIREVFGGSSSNFTISWLLPVNIWFPSSVKYQLLGYILEDEMTVSEDELSDFDDLLPAESATEKPITMKETLEGGWSVEKHIHNESTEIV